MRFIQSSCRKTKILLAAVNGRQRLIVKLARALLSPVPPFLLHLLVRGPRQQKKRADDQKTAENGRRGQRRVERRGEQLVDNGDDEYSEQRGNGGENGGSERDQYEEGTGEC